MILVDREGMYKRKIGKANKKRKSKKEQKMKK